MGLFFWLLVGPSPGYYSNSGNTPTHRTLMNIIGGLIVLSCTIEIMGSSSFLPEVLDKIQNTLWAAAVKRACRWFIQLPIECSLLLFVSMPPLSTDKMLRNVSGQFGCIVFPTVAVPSHRSLKECLKPTCRTILSVRYVPTFPL